MCKLGQKTACVQQKTIVRSPHPVNDMPRQEGAMAAIHPHEAAQLPDGDGRGQA